MDVKDAMIPEDLRGLWEKLKSLHHALRDTTWKTYRRVNPFVENLFAWKEKGDFFGGKNVTIYDSTTVIGDVKIGDDTWVGAFCSLGGAGGITIGRNCSISTGVQVLTHSAVNWALSGGKMPYENRPVVIGDCCFIGVHAVIMPGTTIGSHCLVGAGAVVTHDVPDRTIVAGVPARPIGRVIEQADGQVRLEYDR